MVISTQHAEPLKATTCREIAGYTGPHATAPSRQVMNKLFGEEVVEEALVEITLKSGIPFSAASRTSTSTHPGSSSSGAPEAMLGSRAARSESTPTAVGAHGGGAFSRRDPIKVDRAAAYSCRQMEGLVVERGLCKRAWVRLSDTGGVEKPFSLIVATFGAEQGGLSAYDIINVIRGAFDCRQDAMAPPLALCEPNTTSGN